MTTSVVIATYNGSRFILEQLRSIIHQTVLPTEIVISDDGSTDSTVELIRSFFEKYQYLPIRFKLVLNNPDNHGVLGNFQNAVMNAEGEYIFFSDQDDIWFKNKIERLVTVIELHEEQVFIHNAQIIIESHDGSFKPMDKHLMGNFRFDSDGVCKLSGSSMLWDAFYFCLIQGMCICAKRDYLLSISPFSKGSGHDYWILFCAIADNTLLAVADDLAYYRIHKGNLCGIPEMKKKRPLFKRISTFDYKGKESIFKQYLWYKDTTFYLEGKPIMDERVKILVSFFTKERLEAVSKRKINATRLLIKAYKHGAYRIDGRILLLHDIAFVWMHTRKMRRKYLSGFQKYLRAYRLA